MSSTGKQLLCDQYGEFWANGDFSNTDITDNEGILSNIADDGSVAIVDVFAAG